MSYTIDESLSDTDFTPSGLVGAAFGTPRRYESITVHHWGSFGQTHMGVVNFFMKPNSPTSAHFVASDSLVHCLVSPQDASWAAGNAYGNATSIHIECRPEATAGDYATIAWLISHLRSIYGNLPLKPHSAWASTACPGQWDLVRLDNLARATTTPAKPLAPTAPKEDTLSAAEVKEIKDYMHALTIGGYVTGGRKHPGFAMVAEENQRRINTANGKLAALESLVGQLAKGQGVTIDYAKIEASVKSALADGIDITGEITVGGAK